MPVVFQTPTLLDVDFIRIIGVSVKVNQNPFGFFGTGLKYAIAVLLRKGLEVRIWIGPKLYVFTTKNKNLRGQEIQMVYMNDEPLGFTTSYGKNWELWQVLRELESNTRDEKGSSHLALDDLNYDELGRQDATDTVILVYGGEFEEEYNNIGKVFVTNTVLGSTSGLEVREGETDDVYYRGVKAHKFSETAKFTYNLLDYVELTEDRTIKYNFYAEDIIKKGVVALDDPDLIGKILTVGDGFREHDIDFSDCVAEGAFLEAVRTNRRNPHLNRSLATMKKVGGGYAIHDDEHYELFGADKSTLEDAIRICNAAGVFPRNYKIIVGDLHGDQSDLSNDVIYLDKNLFDYDHATVAEHLLLRTIQADENCDEDAEALRLKLSQILVGSVCLRLYHLRPKTYVISKSQEEGHQAEERLIPNQPMSVVA